MYDGEDIGWKIKSFSSLFELKYKQCISQLNINVTRTSTQDIDTAVPSTVNRFILNNPTTDILVLNTK